MLSAKDFFIKNLKSEININKFIPLPFQGS